MTVLAVEHLRVTIAGWPIVRDLSFSIPRGTTLGLVGESGSGKSMTALAIMRLLPAVAQAGGAIRLNGEDLMGADEARLCALRGNRIALVFQEPMTALNPVHTVGDQIAEPMMLHRHFARHAAMDRAASLLERVGIAKARARLAAYPHQLFGDGPCRILA